MECQHRWNEGCVCNSHIQDPDENCIVHGWRPKIRCLDCGVFLPIALRNPPPPKESQNIPALDKPAEGLFEVFEGNSAFWVRTTSGTIVSGGMWDRAIAQEIADKMNSAHASIIKPLREKVESLLAQLIEERNAHETTEMALCRTRDAHHEMVKDRDALKGEKLKGGSL